MTRSSRGCDESASFFVDSSWTSSRSRPRTSGSVRREHAVAEVEDVAGPTAGPREDRRGVAASIRSHGPSRTAGRGCPARRGRRRPAPSPRRAGSASRGRSRRRRRAAIAGQQREAPVPKWIVGTSTRGEDARRPRARRTRRSRPARAPRPTSRRAARRRRRRAPARRGTRAKSSASFSSSASQTAGSRVHQRLDASRTRATASPRRGSRRR